MALPTPVVQRPVTTKPNAITEIDVATVIVRRESIVQLTHVVFASIPKVGAFVIDLKKPNKEIFVTAGCKLIRAAD
jgi:hypothetical protein